MPVSFFTEWELLTILEFKEFQGPLKLNSKTFKDQIRFQGLSRAFETGKIFQGLSR